MSPSSPSTTCRTGSSKPTVRPNSTAVVVSSARRRSDVAAMSMGRRSSAGRRGRSVPGGGGRHGQVDVHRLGLGEAVQHALQDRKSTRLNSSHANISYAVFCLKKKKKAKIH